VSVVRRAALGRWSAVAGGVVALCLLPSAVGWWPTGTARADPGALRELVLASANRPYQGYVDSHGDVGLPDLPQLSDVTGLFGGSTSVRVWHAAPHAWRVAVVEPTGERDIYRTAEGTFVWDFRRNQFTAILGGDLPVRLPWAADVVPPELARRLLGAAAGTDQVRAIGSRRVAGVLAAGLRLTPADPDATIGSVDIWADPRTGLPLAVEVAQGAQVVFRTRFLELTQRAPAAEVVTPVAASSSTLAVTNQPDVASALNATLTAGLPGSLAGRRRVADPGGVTGVAAYGDGFTRFVVAPLPGRVGFQSFSAVRDGGGTPVELPGGGAEGYVVRAAVLTTLVVRTTGRRTYLLAGFVTPELLARAATDLVAVAR
jgi:hypothetical protein